MNTDIGFAFPKPKKMLIAIMIAIAAIWIFFAAGVNWFGMPERYVHVFLGNTSAILHGQVWRLVTAPLVHLWAGNGATGHLITTLLGLYFLGTPLEARWGAKRFLLFLLGAGVFAFVLQAVGGLVISQLDQPYWFGGLGMVEATAIAWALQARGQTVRLFFVLPVSSTGLILFILAMSVLNVIAMSTVPEGLITPFGGMLAGYLLGDASPLRRYFLRQRLRALEAEAERMSSQKKFRVIQGGQNGSNGANGSKDKKYLH